MNILAPLVADSRRGEFTNRSLPPCRHGMLQGLLQEASFLHGTAGHLVTLTSAAEEQFIRANFATQFLWLGLTDEASEGAFKRSRVGSQPTTPNKMPNIRFNSDKTAQAPS